MSLTSCLSEMKRAGIELADEHRLEVMRQTRDLRAAGVAGPEAARQAAEAQLALVAAQLAEAESAAQLLKAQTEQELRDKTEREARAAELDQRAQIDREAGGFGLEIQSVDNREDTTGDMFGGPSIDDAMAARDRERARRGEAPAGPDLFSGPPASMFDGDATEEPAAAPSLRDRVDAKKVDAKKQKALDDLNDALGDLGDILGKNVRKNLTPEQEQKLLPVLTRVMDAAFRAGYYSFRDAARFVLDKIRSALGADVADAITLDHLQGAYIGMAGRYREDAQYADSRPDSKRAVIEIENKDELERDDESAAGDGVERSGQDGRADGDQDVRGAVPPGAAPAGRGAGQPDAAPGAVGDGPGRGAGLADGDAAADGERVDQPRRGARAGSAPGPARDRERERSAPAGDPRVQPEAAAGAETADADSHAATVARRVAAQKLAGAKPVTFADRANIDETLPLLLPEQRDDVMKAEVRFAAGANGMLFTNGTGTGKTFTGLGIVKRMHQAGKRNILIAAPNDKILNDWIRSGGMMGLQLTKLEDTKDTGRGIVVTTYANLGQNLSLADRDWDAVVMDEAHYLSSNKDGDLTGAAVALQALTLHPAGYFARTAMLHRELDAQMTAAFEAARLARTSDDERDWARVPELEAKASKLAREYEAKRDAVKADVMAKQGARPKAVFLSATPFAWVPNLNWAQGYLFDWHEGKGEDRASGSGLGHGYNSGDHREQFYMERFGYRMRYNKLTRPEAGVDVGLMERQFNSWLKQTGALSGRALEVPADYDRRFVATESVLGRRIDEALSRDPGDGFDYQTATEAEKAARTADDEVRSKLHKTFAFQQRQYFLEAIKARAAVPYIQAQLDRGRKVVVFHDFKKGGVTVNPFSRSVVLDGAPKDGPLAAAYDRWAARFPDLAGLDIAGLLSPIEVLSDAFEGRIGLFNGDIRPKDGEANVARFNSDDEGPQILLVQSAKAEGWSGHDTTGKYPRVLLNLGMPTRPFTAIQQEGRIYRTGQVSDAMFRYMNTGTSWERTAFAHKLAERAETAENLAMGEAARALKQSYIDAFEDSDTFEPGHDGEGKGGKEADRASNNVISEYDAAKSFYFAQAKRTQRNKSREGTNYFATPEPIGLKMVRWLDFRAGETGMEPSAGHGAIARWFPDHVPTLAVEPSDELRSRLALVFNGNHAKLREGVFEDLDIGANKADGIAMNPPFGLGGSDAFPHLAKAVKHLRDGGRVVAIVPRGGMADKRLDKFLEEHPELHLVADIQLHAGAFERAGTGVATRIIAFDKGVEPEGSALLRDLSGIESVAELFDRLENMELPRRGKKEPTAEELAIELNARATKLDPSDYKAARELKKEAEAANKAAGSSLAQQLGLTLIEYTTKKGKLLKGVIRTDLTKAQVEEFDEYPFHKDGGFFIREKDLAKAHELYPFPSAGGVDFSLADDAPPFYSALARAVESASMKTGPAASWRQWLKGLPAKGIKPDEIEWSGLPEWLDMQEGKVTREAVAQFLEANGVRVTETVLGDGAADTLPEGWQVRRASMVDGASSEWALFDDEGEIRGEGATYAEALADGWDPDVAADAPTKYSNYTLPGGTNYREVLLTLPPKSAAWNVFDARDRKTVATFATGAEARADAETRGPAFDFGLASGDINNYRSNHWDQKNILAHIRVNDRTDADGKRVLFVEEIQSDWGQAGKKDGFKAPFSAATHEVIPAPISSRDTAVSGFGIARKGDPDKIIVDGVYSSRSAAEAALAAGGVGEGVPAAPFVDKTDKWVTLALKRVIKMAVDEGYDRVAFVTGEQSAERYDLSKQVDELLYRKNSDGTYRLSAITGGRGNMLGESLPAEKLEDYVGKEIAQRIIDGDGKRTEVQGAYDPVAMVSRSEYMQSLSGNGLKVGGEGMRAFYDKIVPSALKPLLKKMGGEGVEAVVFGGADESGRFVVFDEDSGERLFRTDIRQEAKEYIRAYSGDAVMKEVDGNAGVGPVGEQPGFTITPAMREKAAGGLPLFRTVDDVDQADAAPDTAAYGRANPDDRAALRRAESSIRSARPDLVLDAVPAREGGAAEQPLRGPDRARVAAAELARRLFGKRVVFFRSNKPFANGFYSSSDDNRVFLNADSRVPHMAVLGHELLHAMRRDRPDLYDALKARVMAASRDVDQKDLLLQLARMKQGLPKLEQDKMDEEFIADVVGDRFMEPDFWQAMAKDQPGAFKRTVQAVLRFLDDVLAALTQRRPFNTSAYLRDIQAARDAVADALRNYSSGEVGAMTGERDGEVSLSISRRDLLKGMAGAAAGAVGTNAQANPEGMVVQGNIDLDRRPRVENADGSISTVESMSFAEGEVEVLVPTITPAGKRLTSKEAIARYKRTGEHLGKFVSEKFATKYAKALSQRQGSVYGADEDIQFSLDDASPARQTVRDFMAATRMGTTSRFNALHKTISTQLHKASANPDFARVFGIAQDFEQDVARAASRPSALAPDVLPAHDNVRSAFTRLVGGNKDKETIDKVGQALFAGTMENGPEPDTGVIWSDAALRGRFGLDDKGVRMYRQSRKAIDASLDETAASLAFQMVKKYVPQLRRAVRANPGRARALIEGVLAPMAGDPELDAALSDALGVFDRASDLKAGGYTPLMRFGRYAVDVVGDGGQRLHFEKFDTELQAKIAAQRLAREYPGATIDRSTMSEEAYKLFAGVDPESVALFADQLGDRIDGIALQEWYRKAISDRSAMKRMIGPRKGVAGYSPDLARVLASFITSNAKLSARQMNMGDMAAEIADMQERRVAGDVVDEAIGLRDYLDNPDEPFKGMRSLMFTWYLGGSVASAAVNLTQPVMMTGPYLSQFGNATKALLGAVKEAMTGKVADERLRNALERAAEDGKVDPQEVHHLYHAGMAGMIDKLPGGQDLKARAQGFATLWGTFFGAAENFNRRVTFIAAYRMALADETLGNPYDFAVRAIDETQGIYNKSNRPNWARGTGSFGALGVAAFTFKQYSIAYVELLVRMSKSGPQGKRAALAMLGMLVLASGLQGIPGMEDLEDLIDTAAQMMGYRGNTHATMRESLVDAFGASVADAVMYGASSGLPLDFSGRLGLGDLLPATAILKPSSERRRGQEMAEILGPMGGFASQVGDFTTALDSGASIGKAMSMFAPIAVKNALMGARMAEDGYYSDTRGRKVVDTDDTDAAIKAIGFQPTSVAERRRPERLVAQDITRVKGVEADIVRMRAEAIVEKDPAKRERAAEILSQWNERNPDLRIRIKDSQVLQMVKQMRRTSADRLIDTAPRETRRALEDAL